MTAGRLYYVMGSPGAGKNGVLGWLRDNGLSRGGAQRVAVRRNAEAVTSTRIGLPNGVGLCASKQGKRKRCCG